MNYSFPPSSSGLYIPFIDEQKIKSIVNNGAYHDILEEIEQFIDFICTQKKAN